MLQVLKPLLGPFLARSVMPPINAILDKYCIWSHLYLITSSTSIVFDHTLLFSSLCFLHFHCYHKHDDSWLASTSIWSVPSILSQEYWNFHFLHLMIATYFHHQHFHWHDHKKTIITLDMDRLLDLWFFNLLLYVLVIAAFATFLILDTKVVALD